MMWDRVNISWNDKNFTYIEDEPFPGCYDESNGEMPPSCSILGIRSDGAVFAEWEDMHGEDTPANREALEAKLKRVLDVYLFAPPIPEGHSPENEFMTEEEKFLADARSAARFSIESDNRSFAVAFGIERKGENISTDNPVSAETTTTSSNIVVDKDRVVELAYKLLRALEGYSNVECLTAFVYALINRKA